MANSTKKIAISVKEVSKSFKLPHEKNSSVKGALVNIFHKKRTYETQNVLRDINFDVEEGEFFGIVGRNGSGKSTLLKLLAGIYTPDEGTIQVNGGLTPFIELGVGFSPELTGRENVFLNGALLGFSRKEMSIMYDDIVAFAELEKFMDQKLKNYSSGMQVRLAFSIAIQAKNEILVLDEVLAVGDAAFQQKCTTIFEEYKARKQTIILVTHSMDVVEKFCTRAMMIEDGDIIAVGSPSKIGNLYSEKNRKDYALQREKSTTEQLDDNLKIETLDEKSKIKKNRFVQGETMTVNLAWTSDKVQDVGVAVMKRSGEYIFGPNTYEDKFKLKGAKSLAYRVTLNVGPGEYFLKAGTFVNKAKDVIDFIDEGPTIIVEPAASKSKWGGIAELPHGWGDDSVKL